MEVERATRKSVREESAARRLAATGPTRLALAFAGIAQELYDAESYDDVLTRIATAAVTTIAGAHAASVTLLTSGGYRSAGPTDPAAFAVDNAQFDAGEGPALDAVMVPLVHAPSFPDDRWPVLGAQPTVHGVHSSLSYQLAGSTSTETGIGALNVYASSPEAFDQVAEEIGVVLAAHASLAARAVGERATLESLGQQLEQALFSREVIGQATGILMERLKATPEQAFDILSRSSQRLNLKLREVARRLTETGELSPQDLA